jgi:hypothetical protein
MIPGSCFGQVMPQAQRLIQIYDIAKGLMRDFKIFPHENEEAAILDIDESNEAGLTYSGLSRKTSRG